MSKVKLISRIRSLLARASEEQNDNPHEREIAMRHAHRLMEEHTISMLEVSEEELGSINRESMQIGVQNWKRSLVGLVASLYGCAVCWPSKQDSRNLGDIYIYGRDNNRITVQMISEFVINSIEAEWESYKERTTRSNVDKNSFCVGALYGVRDTIIELKKARETQAESSSQALAVIDKYEKWQIEAKEAMPVNSYAKAPTEVKDMKVAFYGRSVGKRMRLEPHLEESNEQNEEQAEVTTD